MKGIYGIKDWMEYLGASRSTVTRYIKSGLIPEPDINKPRPMWQSKPMLVGFQPNPNTSPSS